MAAPAHGMLYGTQAICEYLGISVSAFYRWRDRDGLPVAYAPDGKLMTSTALVDQWILERVPEKRHTGRYARVTQIKRQQRGRQGGTSGA